MLAYFPVGHAWQSAAPVPLKVPALQTCRVSLHARSPAKGVCDPASHGSQRVAAGVPCARPGWHASHEVAAGTLWCLPAGQSVHTEAPRLAGSDGGEREAESCGHEHSGNETSLAGAAMPLARHGSSLHPDGPVARIRSAIGEISGTTGLDAGRAERFLKTLARQSFATRWIGSPAAHRQPNPSTAATWRPRCCVGSTGCSGLASENGVGLRVAMRFWPGEIHNRFTAIRVMHACLRSTMRAPQSLLPSPPRL